LVGRTASNTTTSSELSIRQAQAVNHYRNWGTAKCLWRNWTKSDV